MFLILTHNDDPTSVAVFSDLCKRVGEEKVVLLTDEQLVIGTGWSYTQVGKASNTTLRLPDRRSVSSDGISAVFNRLRYLNGAHFASFEEVDRTYAVGEMYALLLNWLTSLQCRVVNPAGLRGFNSSGRSFLDWFKLAGDVGLPVRNAHFTTDARLMPSARLSAFQPLPGMTLAQAAYFPGVASTVLGRAPTVWLQPVGEETQKLLVVGEDVFGGPREFAKPCLALADRARLSLVEFIFVRSNADDAWLCGWINPFPQLSGQEVSAVAKMLENG